MTDDSSELAYRFVCGVRLRHVCTALGLMHQGMEGSFSLFEGDLESGCCWAVDELGHQAIAWSQAGVVALVYVGEDDTEHEISKSPSECRPERYFEDAPPGLRSLVERVVNHPHVHRMATAGFWFTKERPDLLERLREERLQPLRGYLRPPEAAIYEDDDSWARTVLFLPKEWGSLAIKFEAASRQVPYEVSSEDGEALLPPAWFRKPGETPKPITANPRPTGDFVKPENLILCVEKLAEAGITWKSASQIAKARGVEPEST